MRIELQSVFLPLLRHELRQSVTDTMKRKTSRNWKIIYWMLASGAVLAVTTFFGMMEKIHFNPDYIWLCFWLLPWAVFAFAASGVAGSGVAGERVRGTYGWWLIMPQTRQTLLMAKFCAVMIRGLTLSLGFYLLVIIVAGYATLISSDLTFSEWIRFSTTGVGYLGLTLLAFPVLSVLGGSFGIIGYTNWRPDPVVIVLATLFSGFLGLLLAISSKTWRQILYLTDLIIVYALIFALFMPGSLIGRPEDGSEWALSYPLAASWFITWLFLQFCSYLLEKKLDL